MSLWLARATVLVSNVAMMIIRGPHGQRSTSVKVAKSRKGRLEIFLLIVAWIGFLPPILWAVMPFRMFADYPLRSIPLIGGILSYALGLWLLYRSHADLGTNWSITLEIREQHQLVTRGIYQHIRHPMYLGLLLWALGQALALPNWVAGPSYFVAFSLLFAFRIRAEERMMVEEFGQDYQAYRARTKRLIPRVW